MDGKSVKTDWGQFWLPLCEWTNHCQSIHGGCVVRSLAIGGDLIQTTVARVVTSIDW